MAYQKFTKQQRWEIAKKFTKAERQSYKKGQRYGFLCGVHAPAKRKSFHYGYDEKGQMYLK